MNATRTRTGAWVLVLTGAIVAAGSARVSAQGLPSPPPTSSAALDAALPPTGLLSGPGPMEAAPPLDPPPPIGEPLALPKNPVPSPWIGYSRPNCCGPIGLHGPITYELYGRIGPSMPIAGGIIADSIITGVALQGGGRTLLFNAAGDSAWVFDVGIAFNRNDARNQPPVFIQDIVRSTSDLFNPGGVETLPVRISGITRTAVNFTLGKDWFLYGQAFDYDCARGNNIRWGVDSGVRYGSAHVDLDVFNADNTMGYARENGPFLSALIGVHSDYEVPMGSWLWFGGVRFEYSHTWSNLLPSRRSNLHDLNIMFSGGVRF
jgi:hypothetical protein